jgi:hypothetical protein
MTKLARGLIDGGLSIFRARSKNRAIKGTKKIMADPIADVLIIRLNRDLNAVQMIFLFGLICKWVLPCQILWAFCGSITRQGRQPSTIKATINPASTNTTNAITTLSLSKTNNLLRSPLTSLGALVTFPSRLSILR